jgi:DNA-binding PadR family transcriptional regulator
MDNDTGKALQREVLLAFWRAHILHHAAQEEVVGLWMMEELRRHGYAVSPGTLYPMLHRMERLGWLESRSANEENPKARRAYRATEEGKRVLKIIQRQCRELAGEIGGSPKTLKGKKA